MSREPLPARAAADCRRSRPRAAPAASPSRAGTALARGARFPYALIAPARDRDRRVLGYPIYYLVRLSFQHYGLFQLIAHKGAVGRARQLHDDPQRRRVLARRSCGR